MEGKEGGRQEEREGEGEGGRKGGRQKGDRRKTASEKLEFILQLTLIDYIHSIKVWDICIVLHSYTLLSHWEKI